MRPAGLSRAEVTRLTQLLRDQRDELGRSTRELRRSLDDVRAARSDGTADDEHDPDGSTLSSDWSRLAGLHDEALARTDATARALERVDTGQYGNCSRCGDPIGIDRLEARPATEFCITCARLQSR